MNDKYLDYADSLAMLSNIETAHPRRFFKTLDESLPIFLKLHPEFFPPLGWEEAQEVLAVLWREHFPLGKSIQLILAIDRLSYYLKAYPKEIPTEQRPSEDLPIPNYMAEMCIASTAKAMVWPAQFAIMFLATNPWRARFCSSCGQRFVADKPSRRYCGDRCSHEARKKGKLASYYKNGKTWRPNKKVQSKKRKSR